MHLLLPFFASFILLVSCSVQYQYGTIKSPEVSMNDKNEFVADNDTICIRYNFNSAGAPVGMVIENKLDLPVYIDWKQSALIVNGNAITYAPADIPITGDVSMTRTNLGTRTERYSTGSISAVASVQPGMAFLPPHTFIEKPLAAFPIAMVALTDSISRKVTMPNGVKIKLIEASFTDSTSPLRFRSYLTISVGEITARQLRIEHNFYVSDLISTKINPAEYGYPKQNRSDKYVISQSVDKGGGVILGVLLVGGLIAAAAAGSQQASNNGE